ncbi:MAG: hypothetical protein IMX03_05905 [Brockia lithotrophica]|nr:hypothetical protein [Brockia lithotrophica]
MRIWSRIWSFLFLGYNLFGRSFAYLGVTPIFIGEFVLSTFLFFRPRAVFGRWASWLLSRRSNVFSTLAWSLLMFFFYGLIQVLLGFARGNDLFLSLQNLVFNVYPLYIFLGLEVGLRYTSLLRKIILLFAWFNGIYGILYIFVLNKLDIFLPWASDVSLFGQPTHSFVAIIGILVFESRIHHIWLPFLLNFFVLLGIQARGEWLALIISLIVWAIIKGRLRSLVMFIISFLLLVSVLYIADLRIPAPLQRGGEISVQGVVARFVAPFNPELAVALVGESAYSFAGTVTGWRIPWWVEIWQAVNADLATSLLGFSYGYPLWNLSPANPEGVRTPHNIFFYTLGYTGWLGVLLFLLFLFSLIRSLYRASLYDPNGELSFIVSLGSSSSAIFGNYFETPYGAIPFYLLAGYGLSSLVRGVNKHAVPSNSQLLPATRW